LSWEGCSRFGHWVLGHWVFISTLTQPILIHLAVQRGTANAQQGGGFGDVAFGAA
jgi:hypothetical protein